MLMFDSNCVHIHMNKYIPLIITSYLYIKACAYVNTFLKNLFANWKLLWFYLLCIIRSYQYE